MNVLIAPMLALLEAHALLSKIDLEDVVPDGGSVVPALRVPIQAGLEHLEDEVEGGAVLAMLAGLVVETVEPLATIAVEYHVEGGR